MDRHYKETDVELMKRLLELQKNTSAIGMSIGYTVNGQVKQGIVLHEAAPKVVETLIQEGYSCSLMSNGLHVYKL